MYKTEAVSISSCTIFFLLFLFFSSQELDKQLVHLTTRVNLLRKMKANIDRASKSN